MSMALLRRAASAMAAITAGMTIFTESNERVVCSENALEAQCSANRCSSSSTSNCTAYRIGCAHTQSFTSGCVLCDQSTLKRAATVQQRRESSAESHSRSAPVISKQSHSFTSDIDKPIYID